MNLFVTLKWHYIFFGCNMFTTVDSDENLSSVPLEKTYNYSAAVTHARGTGYIHDHSYFDLTCIASSEWSETVYFPF